MRPDDFEKQYDAGEDPDTDAPETPEQVEGEAERDQAEGDEGESREPGAG